MRSRSGVPRPWATASWFLRRPATEERSAGSPPDVAAFIHFSRARPWRPVIIVAKARTQPVMAASSREAARIAPRCLDQPGHPGVRSRVGPDRRCYRGTPAARRGRAPGNRCPARSRPLRPLARTRARPPGRRGRARDRTESARLRRHSWWSPGRKSHAGEVLWEVEDELHPAAARGREFLRGGRRQVLAGDTFERALKMAAGRRQEPAGRQQFRGVSVILLR